MAPRVAETKTQDGVVGVSDNDQTGSGLHERMNLISVNVQDAPEHQFHIPEDGSRR